jgi:hypothetical protein
MQANQWPSLPVVDGRRLVGLITMENISEYLMVRAALDALPSGDGQREAMEQMAARYPTWRPADPR